MQTIIDWKDPKQEAPPFEEPFLALLGGQNGTGFPIQWSKYAVMLQVVMKEFGPCDEEDTDDARCDFEDAVAESGPGCFDEFQFCLHDEDDEALDWYSDSILRWAPVPDFSEAIGNV